MSEVPVPPGDPSVEPQAHPEEEHMSATLEDPATEPAWDDDVLPGRPRRRFLTPLTAVLLAALVGGGGFIAGVQVEKGQVTTSASGGGGRAGRAGGLAAAGSGLARSAGAGAGAGGATANATVGQVANISGSDLFVTDLQGNTIKVNASVAQVTKQVSATPAGIHPGDTVIAQGSKAADGSVQATTIRDSGAGTGGATGGLLGGGAGSSGSGTGASGSGTGATGGGGAAGGGQSLFGSSRGG
jgi:hypothetical protein